MKSATRTGELARLIMGVKTWPLRVVKGRPVMVAHVNHGHKAEHVWGARGAEGALCTRSVL